MAPTMTEVLLEKKSNNNDLQIRGDLTKTIENDNTRINTMIIEEADNNVERIGKLYYQFKSSTLGSLQVS